MKDETLLLAMKADNKVGKNKTRKVAISAALPLEASRPASDSWFHHVTLGRKSILTIPWSPGTSK